MINHGAVWQVSSLTAALKHTIEDNFGNVTVEGEISNFRPASSGHLYFTLKDDSAQLRAVMFRSRAAYVMFKPRDGVKVQCTGALSVYPARGEYQIVVTRMALCGSGDILQMLEERKRALAAEGLFDKSRKKPIPLFPTALGIVTSATGAALRDILQVARRRNPRVNIIIFPASVQGEEAAGQIAHQIECANALDLCDVLIVGRGGGSIEDLLPFSEETVIRAVANSHIPLISAVGHEIDWALIDYASDYRAPTPSAAAEVAVPILSDITALLEQYRHSLYDGVRQCIERARSATAYFSIEGMELRLRSIEQPLVWRLDAATQSLQDSITSILQDRRNRITLASSLLESGNPQAVMERGYAVVRRADTGEVLRAANAVNTGDNLNIKLYSGTLAAKVI